MSQNQQSRSPLIQFLDAFLREENIKWMLGAGVCILLGSSLRLVTMHWNECTPLWKYLILLSYTGIVFPLGELSYHRLGLRKTGTVLMVLTILLIPLSFLALHWVRPPDQSNWSPDLLHNSALTGLVGLNLVWSTFAANRIFCHFLRKPQPTFLACYLLLCTAGAIVPGLPMSWTPLLTLSLWAIFTLGTIKVNRHVFWLTEEHRLPRICGFMPILLLGLQFTTVFLFSLVSHLTVSWLGLLCTLLALPILLTANAVARVFEQRTGQLIKPLPWSISGPLVLGTLLCATGVVLAMSNFPQSSLVVPSAALAAVAFAVIAPRTRRSEFVWMMIACIAITYQTTPVFFKELVVYVRDQAAATVHESRLPYAFYGLTYAPLIIAFSLISRVLKKHQMTLFASPLQKVATVLPSMLLIAAWTHPSAVFPVSLVLGAIMAGQVILFRQRELLVPVLIAFLTLIQGLPDFTERYFHYQMSLSQLILAHLAGAAFLLFPGRAIDRWSHSLSRWSLPAVLSNSAQEICERTSLLVILVASLVEIFRLSQSIWASPDLLNIPVCALIGVLLFLHTLRWNSQNLAEWTLVFTSYVAVMQLTLRGLGDLSSSSTMMLLTWWIASYAIQRFPASRMCDVFFRPLISVSTCGLSLLYSLLILHCVVAHWGGFGLSWATATLIFLWGLDASRRFGNAFFATIVWSTTYLFASALATSAQGMDVAPSWYMSIWSATGIGLLGVYHAVKRLTGSTDPEQADPMTHTAQTVVRHHLDRWTAALATVIPLPLVLIAVTNLYVLDVAHRTAGAISLCGILLVHRSKFPWSGFSGFWPLLNYGVLATVATIGVPTGMNIVSLTSKDLLEYGLPLAVIASASLLLFEFKKFSGLIKHPFVLDLHRLVLFLLTLVLLAGPWQTLAPGQWDVMSCCLAGMTWCCLVAVLLLWALEQNRVDLVWAAEATLGMALIYLAIAGGWSLSDLRFGYLALLTGVIGWWLGSICDLSCRYRLLSVPLKLTGFLLPLAVVPLAVYRNVNEISPWWIGANSLPLLGAALFYFWRGLQDRQIGSMVLSAGMLNLSTILVWKELNWTDPQLFLIPVGISVLAITEFMRREIPKEHHQTLRLIGALIILVSPTFHILSGDWRPILSLLVVSVAVALLAIGLRVRVLLYTSSAFLAADLMALVWRGSVDHPHLLWIVGAALGASVIALGAICENHRELILARLRGLAAELQVWN